MPFVCRLPRTRRIPSTNDSEEDSCSGLGFLLGCSAEVDDEIVDLRVSAQADATVVDELEDFVEVPVKLVVRVR